MFRRIFLPTSLPKTQGQEVTASSKPKLLSMLRIPKNRKMPCGGSRRPCGVFFWCVDLLCFQSFSCRMQLVSERSSFGCCVIHASDRRVMPLLPLATCALITLDPPSRPSTKPFMCPPLGEFLRWAGSGKGEGDWRVVEEGVLTQKSTRDQNKSERIRKINTCHAGAP